MSKKLTHVTFRASIKNGVLVYDNERYMRTLISNYADTDKVRVIVEKERGTRSRRANNYLWGVVYPLIAEYMGETPEDVHEIMRSKFLRTKRIWRGGELTILKSTTQLTSLEFGEYVERIIQEAAGLGISIPIADKEYRVHEQFPESRIS